MYDKRCGILRNNKLVKLFKAYLNNRQKYRCKIVGTKINHSGETHLRVTIDGIKNVLAISFAPEELVLNNSMLREFAQEDVRAITFYAIKNLERVAKKLPRKLTIKKQEFLNNRTIYVIEDEDKNSEIRKTARELYADSALLTHFCLKEIINIVSTAVQEQLMEDLEN